MARRDVASFTVIDLLDTRLTMPENEPWPAIVAAPAGAAKRDSAQPATTIRQHVFMLVSV
jgi:hypothetical protein